MKNIILVIGIFITSFLFHSFVLFENNSKHIQEECHFEEIQLFGKIRFVEFESEADISIKIVNNFPDLKVQLVENFPDQCGKWQVVEHSEDVKVYITENFQDIKVQFVNNFPGIQNN